MWTAVMPQSRCPPSAVLISVGLCAEWVVLFSCAHLCSDISFVTQVLLQTVDMHSLTVQECVYYRLASGAEVVCLTTLPQQGKGSPDLARADSPINAILTDRLHTQLTSSGGSWPVYVYCLESSLVLQAQCFPRNKITCLGGKGPSEKDSGLSSGYTVQETAC